MPRKFNPPNNKKRRVVAPEDIDPVLSAICAALNTAGVRITKASRQTTISSRLRHPFQARIFAMGMGLPAIKLREAIRLFRSGIGRGMVSSYLNSHGLPVRVWSVDEHGHAYEAKPGGDGRRYHGFRLVKDASTARYIRQEWQRREDPSDV